MSNWRPITLLNTDYKIFSKLIALRLQSVIEKIVHTDQKGFIKGRSISELIRYIDDSILSTRYNQISGLIVSVDFRKAFDSISKSTILNALKRFCFGPSLVKLVSVLLKNTESCVRNYNWFSSFFPCEKGVRQGCCASPYLFLLVAELLSIRLRSSSEISGISIPNTNININKILQYADDTSLFLKDERELESALNIIEAFSTVSGLKLNRQKSIALPLGGYIQKESSLSNVKWLKSNEYIKILGVYFSAEKEASTIELNWKRKIDSILKMINSWNKRNISMYGKIILCKTFILSKINYLIQSLSLPEQVLAEIDRIMFRFIWQKSISNKRVVERISRNMMCQDTQFGGLKMISVKDQQNIFHINWIKKINEHDNNFKHLVNYLTKNVGGISYIMKGCNLENPHSVLDNLIESYFWKKAICTWCKLGFQLYSPSTATEELLYKPLFLNEEFKYHNVSLHFPQWIQQNLLYIHDLFQNNYFLDYKELVRVVKNNPGFIFEYNALFNSIPNSWKVKLNNIDQELVQKAKTLMSYKTKFENYILNLNNKEIRKLILTKKSITRYNEKFWKRKLNVDISKHYMCANNATKESRLRLLHFKIMHNIYPTNILLCKMNVRPNNLCNNCQVPDFIEHFFVECQLIRDFWRHVINYIKSSVNVTFNLSTRDILLGVEKSEHRYLSKKELNYINFIILLGKLCVSKFKYGEIQNINLIFELEINLRQKYLK